MTGSSPLRARAVWLERNRSRISLLAALLVVFVASFAGIERDEWFSVLMQGLSVGALTFLVASGLSLIFGLMDVLNLAHGELFMVGAYVGWTVYTRFDTALDVSVPILVVAAPFALGPWWGVLARRVPPARRRAVAGLALAAGAAVTMVAVTRFPLVIWSAEDFARSPSNFSVQVGLGTLAPLPPDVFTWPPGVAFASAAAGGALLAIGTALVGRGGAVRASRFGWCVGMLAAAVTLWAAREPIVQWVFGLSTTWRFFLAVAIAVGMGAALGVFIEVALIRPLYDRPLYHLMVTLGVGFIIVQAVRDIWGRPEFTMARPAAFDGTGPGCPGEGLSGFFSGCSTVELLGSRLRVYNEGFVILVGVVVLVAVTWLLKRTRIGMIIRAGVQDREMVEALGIDVRRVFTRVFALGSALAALGGVLAAPSIGLGTGMGAAFLLSAIVALAVGGLTSFPGAAAGAVLVGLLQQVVIRFGQSGIALPFLEEPFKPSPSLVPAAAILLMVVVLVVLPSGLFGRGER